MTTSHTSNPFRRSRRCRRGSVIAIVIWSLSIAVLVTAALQVFAQRQAVLGRETLGRIEARWAARAGVERTIAVMEDFTVYPEPYDAMAMVYAMEQVAADRVFRSSYDIRHHVNGTDYRGPKDEHAKLNVNTGDQMRLLLVPNMTPDVVDSMLDWIEPGDVPRPLGAKADWYFARGLSYKPRGAPFRSLAEIELVAGVWPRFFRGEDWNLNNRLDPNENDGGETWPDDRGDGILDQGWAGHLTVYSRRHSPTASGLPRIWLREAEPEELVERLGVTQEQAAALLTFGERSNSRLSTLLTTPLAQASQPQQQRGGRGGGRRGRGGQTGAGQDESAGTAGSGVAPLSSEQLRKVLAETSIENPELPRPGRINVNTVDPDFLRLLMPERESLADEIIYLRRSRIEGIGSLVDLLEIPNVTDEDITYLTSFLDVYSNVYTISSRGRSEGTGLEVEMIVVVDRSTVPARIIEYREQ